VIICQTRLKEALVAIDKIILIAVEVERMSFVAIPQDLADIMLRANEGHIDGYKNIMKVRRHENRASDYPEILLALSWLMTKIVESGVYIDNLQEDLNAAKILLSNYTANLGDHEDDRTFLINQKITKLQSRIEKYRGEVFSLEKIFKLEMQTVASQFENWNYTTPNNYFEREFGNNTYALLDFQLECTDHMWVAVSLRISNKEFDEAYRKLGGKISGHRIQWIRGEDFITKKWLQKKTTYKFSMSDNKKDDWYSHTKIKPVLQKLLKDANNKLNEFNHSSGLAFLQSIKSPESRKSIHKNINPYQQHSYHFLQAMLGRFNQKKYSKIRSAMEDEYRIEIIDLRELEIPAFSFLK